MKSEPIRSTSTWIIRKPIKNPKNSNIPHNGAISAASAVIIAPVTLRTE